MGTTIRSFQAATRQPALESACILLDLLEGIEQRLSGPDGLNDENIHWIRKTCKKLRALLRLLRPALEDSAYCEADGKVRAFAKQLAHARDSHVLTHTLERLEQHFATVLSADALTPVRTLLTDNASGRHDHIPETAGMQAGLIEVCDSCAHLDYPEVTLDTLVDGLIESYRRGRKALQVLEAHPDDEPSHILRRHSKYLYNQFLLLSGLNEAALTPVVEDYHSLEDALGIVHDITVLIDTVRSSSALRDQPLHRELVLSLAESRWLGLLSDGMRLARRLYARKPAAQRAWLRAQLGLE